MRDAIAGLAAAAIRPIVAESLAGVERLAVFAAVLAGCGLLAVVALIGFLAAGAAMLAPAVGTAGAVAIGAGVLLLVSLAGGLWARGMLRARPAAGPAGPPPVAAGAPAGPAPAKGPAVDATLVAAACVAAVLVIGPWRVLRTARRAIDVVRLAASVSAGLGLLRSLGPLVGPLVGALGRAEGPGPVGTDGAARPR